jgi:four helix bundle protein
MTPNEKGSCTMTFIAIEVALRLIRSLRGPVARIRKHNGAVAKQIEAAASSAAANLFEGNRREGRDRRQFFLIAAGSADETRGHLLTSQAWGWIVRADIDEALEHADHLLAILYKLTH